MIVKVKSALHASILNFFGTKNNPVMGYSVCISKYSNLFIIHMIIIIIICNIFFIIPYEGVFNNGSFNYYLVFF